MSPSTCVSAPVESVSAVGIAELRLLDDGGPPVIFRELVGLFSDSTPALLSRACKVLDDPIQLMMIAHTLKGSCSNFGAHPMAALCLELEQMADSGITDGAREIIDAIEREFFLVRTALANHCATA